MLFPKKKALPLFPNPCYNIPIPTKEVHPMKSQRIWAVVGLVLIVASIVCMMASMFAPAAKDLLLNISFSGFIGAAGVLLALSAIRKKQQEADNKDEE